MKKILLIPFLLIAVFLKAQEVDSIYFHLYTDSLKKGIHNYINVDGKLSSGRYVPLTDKQIIFWSSAGTWQGNDLIIDTSYKQDSIAIKATLRSNMALSKTIVIYIKKNKYEGKVLTEDELFNNGKAKKKNN